MNLDQENLLQGVNRSPNERWQNRSSYTSDTWATKIRRNCFLLFLSIFIACSLTIYIYLNLIAIDGNQADQSKFKPLSRRKPMLDHESIFSDSGPSMIQLNDLLAHCIVALQIAGTSVVNSSLIHNNLLKHVGSKGRTLEGANDIVTGADLESHKMILNTIKDSYKRISIVSEEDTTTAFENIKPEVDLLPVDRGEFASKLRANLHVIESQRAGRGSLIDQQETLIWIDPLDATQEYSENLTDYVTLMACIVYKFEPIAGIVFKPFSNETYWSLKDLSTGQYYHSPDLTQTLKESRSPTGSKDLRVIVSRSHAGDVKQVVEKLYGEHNVDIVSAGGAGYKTIELIKSKTDVYVHLTQIKKWDICGPHAIIHSVRSGNMTDLYGNQIGFGNQKEKVVTKGLIATLKPKVHKDLVELMMKKHQKER